MEKKYVVELSDAERQELEKLVSRGHSPVYQVKNAYILLKADTKGPGWADPKIAEAFECHPRTVRNLRERFCARGLKGAVERCRPAQPPRARRLDGAGEARLIALSCSQPPEGFGRWTLSLLADKLVELRVVESISPETVRQTLKKNELKPRLRQQWVIPPEADEEFVSSMEEVLTLYQRPEDKRFPVVNMDEQSVQLLEEKHERIPMVPGRLLRVDPEYIRHGVANIFLFTEALRGWRRVSVRAQRTAVDWAQEVKSLLEMEYPDADQVVLICDNLNTHKMASLYKAFPAAQARQLCRRLKLVHTPKHGSWLNIAEIELSVLKRQYLCRRLADMETLRREVEAWASHRNAAVKGVDWRFTTEDARIQLKRLYPKVETG